MHAQTCDPRAQPAEPTGKESESLPNLRQSGAATLCSHSIQLSFGHLQPAMHVRISTLKASLQSLERSKNAQSLQLLNGV
jgi:hypothetical protein